MTFQTSNRGQGRWGRALAARLAWGVALIVATLGGGLLVQAQTAPPAVPAWPKSATGPIPSPWTAQFHPKVKQHTEFKLAEWGGQTVVRADANQSYGSMALVFPSPSALDSLQWSWAVLTHPTGANPRVKEGDDAAAKVCVFVAIDESRLPLGTRIKLGAARTLSGEALPAATLCYVWADEGQAVGAWFNNPYTDRVRNIVLRSAPAVQGSALVTEQRDLQADARRAFSSELPEGAVKFLGLAFGADADNTQSRAVGVFGVIQVK